MHGSKDQYLGSYDGSKPQALRSVSTTLNHEIHHRSNPSLIPPTTVAPTQGFGHFEQNIFDASVPPHMVSSAVDQFDAQQEHAWNSTIPSREYEEEDTSPSTVIDQIDSQQGNTWDFNTLPQEDQHEDIGLLLSAIENLRSSSENLRYAAGDPVLFEATSKGDSTEDHASSWAHLTPQTCE